MGIIVEEISHYQEWLKVSDNAGIVVINDVNVATDEDKRNVQALTTHTHDKTMVTNEPSCYCGHIRSRTKLGTFCSKCNTTVEDPLIRGLSAMVWFRSPSGVKSLINPHILNMLSVHFSKSNFSYIEWMINFNYNPPKGPKYSDCQKLLSSGIKRGYNNFIENFNEYIKILLQSNLFRDKDSTDLETVLRENENCLFSSHIPLPNKSTLVIEKTSSGIYVDRIIAGIIDVIKSITGIDTSLNTLTNRHKERRCANALLRLGEYYTGFFKEFFAGKTGAFRKHIYGSRGDISMRCVITSITVAHDYDELWLPWAPSINTFSLHLTSKLSKIGYTISEITEILQTVVKPNFNNQKHKYWFDLIASLLDSLIVEHPFGHIPAYYVRNPSLGRGSCELMKITRFKKDPEDQTISMSALVCSEFNADFDGDQMATHPIIDIWTAEQLEPLKPHKNIFDPLRPRELSNMVALTKPALATIMTWFSEDVDETEITIENIDFAKQFEVMT